MFSSFKQFRWYLFLCVVIALLVASRPGYAHGDGEIGDYLLQVGFAVEPAIEGQENGAEVTITRQDNGQGVEGLARTLQVEITHIPSSISKTFELRKVLGEPGRYIADFIPTAPGAYRFRFFGLIEQQEVNATFESGIGSFDEVVPTDTIQFPEPWPSPRELEAATRGAQQSGTEAFDLASSARSIAISGLVAGLAGLVIALGSLLLTFRRK